MNSKLSSLLFTLLFLISCSKSSNSENKPTVTPSSNSSAIYFMSYKQLNRVVPGGLPEKLIDVSDQNTAMLGSNGIFFVDFDALTLAKGYQIYLRLQTDTGIQIVRTVSLGENASFFIRGPVQPSSDGALLLVPMTMTGDGVSERINGFNVIGGLNKVFFSRTNATDPVWVSDNMIVSANKDELQIHNTDVANSSARLGPFGLGMAGAEVKQLAVSPNHQRIAFVQNDAVWAINIDGTGLQQLTQVHDGQSWPAWSPDGNQLAVVSSPCPGLGADAPYPEVVLISATMGNQNIAQAARLQLKDGSALRACGPLYWK